MIEENIFQAFDVITPVTMKLRNDTEPRKARRKPLRSLFVLPPIAGQRHEEFIGVFLNIR